MAEQGEVMEGFICPICMTDFQTPILLTKHSEDYHNDDPEILKSLKDLFGKAKKKILKKDETPGEGPGDILPKDPKPKQEIDWGEQELGETKSHTKFFKDIRNTRLERYSMETNKLLIRLDKLLYNLPNDPVDRKAHERSIVPWMEDKDVRLCLTCAKSFNLTRRKHHCRLCGVLMCHDCTMFLHLTDARKMTSSGSVQDDFALSPTTETRFTDRFVKAGLGLTKLARSPSSSSLNSVLSLISDSSSGEQHFRICQHCKNLLDAREILKARQFDKPIVHQFYEKMQSQIHEANRFLEMYHKMWQSLNEGESTYELRDAQVLRGKIAKIGDTIDTISKRISTLVKIDDDSPAVLKQEFRLHQMVRSSAMIYLKEELLQTPPVPTVEEYTAIQEERQRRIEARIAYERQLEMEEEIKDKRKDAQRSEIRNFKNSATSPVTNQLTLDQSQGWGTSGRPGRTVMLSTTSMDPFIEQMSNLRSYIKQAREECKFEEVATLEKNLKELQSAYFAMQQSNSNK